MGRRTIAFIILIVGVLMLSVVGIIFITSQNAGDDGSDSQQQVDANATPIPDGAEVPDAAPPEQIITADGTVPPMVEVVVSLQTVPRGWQMRDSELATEMRLASEVDSNVITDPAEVVGLYARSDIFQGETITRDDLVEDLTRIGVDEAGPSSIIPQGFIAAGVPMDRLSGVAYALDEGDYIDIMITFFFYQIDEQFQTYLPNSAVLFINEDTSDDELVQFLNQEIVVISPYGRFEELPTGDLVHVGPSEPQRPVPISMILQNARVIQVGRWTPPEAVVPPTNTPDPDEVENTPTPGAIPITQTPEPPEVLLVALSPQQQLFLKYAVESNADIDFALRGVNDGQLYSVENIDLTLFLERYNIEIPPNFNYSVDAILVTVTVTPTPESEQDTVEQRPEGG